MEHRNIVGPQLNTSSKKKSLKMGQFAGAAIAKSQLVSIVGNQARRFSSTQEATLFIKSHPVIN